MRAKWSSGPEDAGTIGGGPDADAAITEHLAVEGFQQPGLPAVGHFDDRRRTAKFDPANTLPIEPAHAIEEVQDFGLAGATGQGFNVQKRHEIVRSYALHKGFRATFVTLQPLRTPNVTPTTAGFFPPIPRRLPGCSYQSQPAILNSPQMAANRRRPADVPRFGECRHPQNNPPTPRPADEAMMASRKPSARHRWPGKENREP